MKWSLEVLEPRVAAGGLCDEVHQTAFVVHAKDAKGAPIAGVPVELPRIWDDTKELSDKNVETPEIIMPHVAWSSPGKTLLTDANGEAHGLFTSGSKTGHVFLRGPGETKADIEQIWNDNLDVEKDAMKNFFAGYPTKHGFHMSLKRGNNNFPISGHHLKLLVTSVTLKAFRLTGELDENGKPEIERPSFKWKIEQPTKDSSPDEMARWETISKWVQIEEMIETSPGVYECEVTITNFNDVYPVVDGMEITSIDNFGPYNQDQGVYVDK